MNTSGKFLVNNEIIKIIYSVLYLNLFIYFRNVYILYMNNIIFIINKE